ncbi:hypothetical protein ACFLQV_01130 [Calditrichota bacterium]
MKILPILLSLLLLAQGCTIIGFGEGLSHDIENSCLQEKTLSDLHGCFKKGMKLIVYTYDGQILEGKFWKVSADSMLHLKKYKVDLRSAMKDGENTELDNVKKREKLDANLEYRIALKDIKHITVYKSRWASRLILGTLGLMSDVFIVLLIALASDLSGGSLM